MADGFQLPSYTTASRQCALAALAGLFQVLRHEGVNALALRTFGKKLLDKGSKVLHNQCELHMLELPIDSPLPPLPPRVTQREFATEDIPVFAPYFINLASSVTQWKQTCHGYVIEKDGVPAASYWYTTSFVRNEGIRKPFLFDVHLRPGGAYFFAVLVRKEYRGRWVPAAVVHYGLTAMRASGIQHIYFFHDTSNPSLGKLWRRYGERSIGSLTFSRWLCFTRKDLSALRLLCE